MFDMVGGRRKLVAPPTTPHGAQKGKVKIARDVRSALLPVTQGVHVIPGIAGTDKLGPNIVLTVLHVLHASSWRSNGHSCRLHIQRMYRVLPASRQLASSSSRGVVRVTRRVCILMTFWCIRIHEISIASSHRTGAACSSSQEEAQRCAENILGHSNSNRNVLCWKHLRGILQPDLLRLLLRPCASWPVHARICGEA